MDRFIPLSSTGKPRQQRWHYNLKEVESTYKMQLDRFRACPNNRAQTLVLTVCFSLTVSKHQSACIADSSPRFEGLSA